MRFNFANNTNLGKKNYSNTNLDFNTSIMGLN